MVDSQAAFAGLIGNLEEYAEAHPEAYRRRVLGLAALGYVYLYGLLALIGAGFIATLVYGLRMHATYFALKLALVMGALFLILLRALWVRVPPPLGTLLRPEDAPELFQVLAKIRKRLDGPPIHRVLLTDDFNAAIVQAPRLGLLGGYRNVLLIGLPLMLTLSRSEFIAVLAHEYGHLAGAHGKFSAWIYRQRASWQRLAESLEDDEFWGAILVRPFMRWFGPYFNAYSFVLARSNEYEADRASAQVAGPQAAVQALATVAVLGRFWDGTYWSSLWRGAQHAPQPMAQPFTAWRPAVVLESRRIDGHAALADALQVRTGYADTHPSFADRIGALGMKPKWRPIERPSAAERFLGERLARYQSAYDQQWREAVRENWSQRHAAIMKAREELAQLDARSTSALGLTTDELFRRADLIDQFDFEEDCVPLYRKVVEAAPAHEESLYRLAFLLCRRGEEEGLRYADRVIELNGERLEEACHVAIDFLQARGALSRTHPYRAALKRGPVPAA